MASWFTGHALILWALYSVVLLLTARPLGTYLYRVFAGERTILHPVLRPLEVGIYRLTRVDEQAEMGWRGYLVASLVGLAVMAVTVAYLARLVRRR